MDAAELEKELEELEVRLERLRALYEQYFLGIEKIEPSVARKDVDRRIWALRRERINNTAKRFKLQTLIQRYNTFQQYWHRICREIENGTYKRHLLRAEKILGDTELLTIASKRRYGKMLRARDAKREADALEAASQSEPAPEPASEPAELVPAAAVSPSPTPAGKRAATPLVKRQFDALDLDLDFAAPSTPAKRELPATKPATPAKAPSVPERSALAADQPAARPATPAARAPAPAPVTPRTAITDTRIQELHERLIQAKRETNDSAQISVAGLAKSIRAAESKLRERHGNRKIDFDVVIKDGRAVVKPIIR